MYTCTLIAYLDMHSKCWLFWSYNKYSIWHTHTHILFSAEFILPWDMPGPRWLILSDIIGSGGPFKSRGHHWHLGVTGRMTKRVLQPPIGQTYPAVPTDHDSGPEGPHMSKRRRLNPLLSSTGVFSNLNEETPYEENRLKRWETKAHDLPMTLG